MICITPRGLISFLSKGWGGRSSDRAVTENSDFLSKLLPGDLVLADRGFDIGDFVGLMCAEVLYPTFTTGMSQMQARDVESRRRLAHLRIHVERVIGHVRNKYHILQSTISTELLYRCEGQDNTTLDKIVHVCCILTNLSGSIVLK